MKFQIDDMLRGLPLPPTDKWKEGVWDIEPFGKDGVRLVFFAPRGSDHQTAHSDHEFYFIARGEGVLVIGGVEHDFRAGDSFFVKAGVHHRFTHFSDDFATWAVFFKS